MTLGEVADGAAEDGGSIFPGEEPVEVELDGLAVGNQKDVDVLLKEQKPPENVRKEGLVVFLNMFRCSHSTGKHKHYVRNIQERAQDIGLEAFEPCVGIMQLMVAEMNARQKFSN